MEFEEQKPRIVAMLHSGFVTLKSSLSTSFSFQILLYYAPERDGEGTGRRKAK